MQFQKPGLGERFRQLGYLLKNTLTIVGRDRAILSPIKRMAIYVGVTDLLFLLAIFMLFFSSATRGWGVLALLVSIALFFYKFFYINRASLYLSRRVYNAACGESVDKAEVRRQLKGTGHQVRVLAWLGMLSGYIASKKDGQGFLLRLVMTGLVELWDLVRHFMLPAFAIEKVNLRDGLGQLKSLKGNVPETLVGVFGIDIMGRVVGTLVGPLCFVLVVLGIAVGLMLGDHLPAGFAMMHLGGVAEYVPGAGPESVFNWLPLFVAIAISWLFGAVFKRVVDAFKVMYFTLFYTRIRHADSLSADLRDELESYLTMQEDQSDSAPAQGSESLAG